MKSLIILLILVCSSCIESKELRGSKKKKITLEVETMLRSVFIHMKEKGYVAELDFLDNSSSFFWIPPGKSQPISYDSVASIIRKFIPGNRAVENSWDTLYVQPLGSRLATYTGRYHARYTDTAGRVSVFRMVDIGVVVKNAYGWKIVSGQTTVLGNVK